MTNIYKSAAEAKKDQTYLKTLTELIYQLADDDLIISHRASEWLGLCPHIEEDVAFSSIAQNTMGHAVLFYQLLEELGEGKADDLAQLRSSEQFRNAILVERVNGEGHYLENPNYDWAYAIIRNYAYEVFKRIRLDALEQSSYAPLVELAAKVKREQFYHLYHWEVWIDQLSDSTDEAKRRLNSAIEKTWADVSTLFDLGPLANEMIALGLIDAEGITEEKFVSKTKEKFASVGLCWPGDLVQTAVSGREGKHSEVLTAAIGELGEVYKLDPQANW